MTENKIIAEDKELLHKMGYAQELKRRMSGYTNFAISFAIVGILAGGINSMAQAFAGAGGASIGIGWWLGAGISAVFALSMAQIASSFPTAGGLYHWASILGNRFTGWLTAWFNLIALVTIYASTLVGGYGFFIGAFGAPLGLEDSYLLKMGLITVMAISMGLINHYGANLTKQLVDFSGYLIFLVTICLILSCLYYAPSLDISRIWDFHNNSGLPQDAAVFPKHDDLWMVFLLSLLLPIYTITGYDASAHASEETVNASHAVPRGIVRSVWWASLFGWLMLVAFLLFVPSIEEAANQGWGVFFWAMNGGMPPLLANFLYIGIFIAQYLCSLSLVTSTSRMTFAFARDNGLPFSQKLKSVHRKHRTPGVAIWAVSVLAVLFTAYAEFYTIVVSVAVIFIFISYALPIACGFHAVGSEKWQKMGPWNIGVRNYRILALLSILGALFIFWVSVQPPAEKALNITLIFFAITAFIWILFEKRRFQGPPMMGHLTKEHEKQIQAIEKLYND